MKLSSKLVLFVLVVLVALSMVACDPGNDKNSNLVYTVAMDTYCAAHDGQSSDLPNIYGDSNICE